MTLSIGVDYSPDAWKTCIVERGQPQELQTFAQASDVIAFLKRTCALYPEPTIVVSSDAHTPFAALHTLNSQQVAAMAASRRAISAESFRATLLEIGSINVNSYCAPSVAYLPGVPIHRKLMRADLGTASTLSAGIALLYRMRERGASWPEMCFLCLDAGRSRSDILVVEYGRIVNGRGALPGTVSTRPRGYETALSAALALFGQNGDQRGEGESDSLAHLSLEAFLEGLTQELAGLMAVHHFEDIVVLGQEREKVIAHFAETYQVYLFPYAEDEVQGYEAALGAALIAEGLYHPGLAAEVVEQLQIREAQELAG